MRPSQSLFPAGQMPGNTAGGRSNAVRLLGVEIAKTLACYQVICAIQP